MSTYGGNNQYKLNHSMPAAYEACLGDCINDLITQLNALTTAYQALLAHLDAANVAGIGNANVATYSASTQVTILANRQPGPST